MRVKLLAWGPYIGLAKVSLATPIRAEFLVHPCPCCCLGGVVNIHAEDLVAAGGDAALLGTTDKYPFAVGVQVTIIKE
jgi:hypothetical protein